MSFERICLESFDEDEPLTDEENEDFKRGFDTAARAAQEEREAAVENSLQELSSTLSDMAFGFEEARTYLSQRLHHLLVQVVETALPTILLESFGAYLNDVIETHFAEATCKPVQISVAPDVADYLSGQTTNDHSRFQFVADQTLAEGQAVLREDETHVMLDLPALLEALQSTLSNFDTLERKENHG